MSAMLRLESFSARTAVPPPPTIRREEVEAARAEGFAAGRAAEAEAGSAAVASALRDLAAALSAAATAREDRATAMRREMADLVRAVIARLAPRLRAEALCERVVDELTARTAATPLACRIRCDAGLVAALSRALEGAGIAGVEVVAGEGPLEVEVPGGALRIDRTGFEAALDRLVGDIAEGDD